ncbi:MAG: Na+/H+ antiporter NhaC family protein [Oscillibacter sp.]|nr:Na+/H+ antiporter NhaC family protein [Oscillibacter sp.]
MRNNRLTRVALMIVAAISLLTITAFAAEEGAEVNSMYGTFWALVPPIIAIALALITKEAYSSLFIGIVVGALFSCSFAPVATLDMIINDGLVAAIADNAGIFLFLVLLGIIVALVNMAGGSAAFGRWAEKNIKTRVGAQLATFVLGILIFIDDYFNCLTVGSVMRPVTDRHDISRPKLAYLIDATAAPVCMIAPISSWAAAVSSTADDLDTGISGIQLFIKAIPYNLYSLLTFVFIIALVLMKFDFGPMAGYEQKAHKSHDLTALAGSVEESGNSKGRVLDLVLPVIVLIITCTIGMIYVGGFFGVDAWGGTDCAGDFIAAFGNTDAFIGLPWGAIIALILTVAYLVARRVVTFKEAMNCVPKGFNAMISPIIILTLAVSLKTTISTLGAAEYVHDMMFGAADALYSMLPAVIFVVACVLAFASGTSWGTFGILIPIVTAIFPADSTLMIIGISACCAGAVCGDHCSPISDTTIMASAGAQVDHVNHVSTQLPYAITVAVVSFVGFIVAGFTQNLIATWVVSFVLMIGTLFVLRGTFGKKD